MKLQIRKPVVGDRIRLVRMPDDPSPIPEGATGEVNCVYDFRDGHVQYGVCWDAPHQDRSLSVVVPPDEIEVIE